MFAPRPPRVLLLFRVNIYQSLNKLITIVIKGIFRAPMEFLRNRWGRHNPRPIAATINFLDIFPAWRPRPLVRLPLAFLEARAKII